MTNATATKPVFEGRKIAKDLTEKLPVVDPTNVGESFIGTLRAISQRQGDNSRYNAYSFENCHGQMTLKISKEETRQMVKGDTVSVSGKAFDDNKDLFVVGAEYGIAYLGLTKKVGKNNPMRLFQILELAS